MQIKVITFTVFCDYAFEHHISGNFPYVMTICCILRDKWIIPTEVDLAIRVGFDKSAKEINKSRLTKVSILQRDEGWYWIGDQVSDNTNPDWDPYAQYTRGIHLRFS